MWFYITAISSVLLVALLALAVLFPLRITITREEPPEYMPSVKSKPKRRPKKRTYDDDELYFDDAEL